MRIRPASRTQSTTRPLSLTTRGRFPARCLFKIVLDPEQRRAEVLFAPAAARVVAVTARPVEDTDRVWNARPRPVPPVRRAEPLLHAVMLH